MASVITNAFLLEVAAEIAANALNPIALTPTVKLTKAPFTPTPGSNPATFVEADYTGYGSQPIAAWGPPHLDDQGQARVDSGTLMNFIPTGTTISNTIYGYWIIDAAGNLVYAERFANAVVLSSPATPLSFVPGFAVRPWVLTTTVVP